MAKFLLDENVRIELLRFLKSQKLDVKSAPRSTADSVIAAQSKKEKRVLVTNDEDFCIYDKKQIFGVIWLKIPQDKPQTLTHAFGKLLNECKDFSGKIVTLFPGNWVKAPLPLIIRI